MKKLLVFLFFGIITIANAKNYSANEKAIKNFKDAYPQAQKVTWGEYPNYSEVRFQLDSIRSIIDYDAEGEIISSKRYYSEQYLPHFILGQVKKKYSNETIACVQEVSDEAGIKYYLTLQNDKNWYTIESDSYGSLTQIEKLKKS